MFFWQNIMETFHDTPNNKMNELVALTFKTSWIKERMDKEDGVINLCLYINWCRIFSSQCALARMAKSLSSH
jgi:hypothetical protein